MDIGISSNSRRKGFLERLKDSTYRHALVGAHIRNGIAFQIRAMRKAKHWDQKKLAEVALGKAELQSMISRYENPDYGKYSMQTLLDLAKAFDVALEVKFAPFSSIVRLDEELPKSILAVPSFTQELEKGVLVSERQSDTSGSFTSVPATESFYRPAQAIKASVVTDNLVYATTFANFLIKPIDAPKVSYACQ